MNRCVLVLVLAAALPAFAGGSNYNVAPGTLPAVKGKVTEWNMGSHNGKIGVIE